MPYNQMKHTRKMASHPVLIFGLNRCDSRLFNLDDTETLILLYPDYKKTTSNHGTPDSDNLKRGEFIGLNHTLFK